MKTYCNPLDLPYPCHLYPETSLFCHKDYL